MKKYSLLLLGLFQLLWCLVMPDLALSQVQTPRYISTGPNSNGYYEYLPAGYTKSTKSYPLLVFVHGEGQLGGSSSALRLILQTGLPLLIYKGQFPDSFNVKGNYHSFIVISPQFIAWPSDNDINDVITYALAHYRVDTGRVYLTGLSMGGGATWSYAASYQSASMLAAIVPISGGQLWQGEAGALNMAHADLAVYAASNLRDATVPSSTTVNDIGLIDSVVPAIQPKALDTLYNASGHDAWTKTYNPSTILYQGLNAYQWMLLYTRDSSDSIPQPATYPAPVPDSILWGSFTATWPTGQSAVTLRWTPAYETNEPYFLVQRSADGKTFTSLDTLPAIAYLGNEYNDSALDPKPLAESDYYRLAAVFMDGKVSYSVIREVTSVSPVQPPRDSVAWSSFTGTWPAGQSEVVLSWATTFESNGQYFLVQRSADGQTFNTFDTVAAAANAASTYNALDPSPFPDSDYYRLEAVFLDGRASYSVIIKVVSMPPIQPPIQDTIAWSAFTAAWTAGPSEVALNWTTTVEQNNHYFLVQRSADGQTFSTLDTMAAAANGSGGHAYSALDPKPLADSDFYRLAAVFQDGSIAYSSIEKIVSVAPPPGDTAHPVQPSQDSVSLSSFTAQVLSGQAEVGLNWTTTLEQNDHYFLVQRSADGRTFNTIDTVPAADAQNGYSYSTVDPQPLADSDFYRLMIVYFDSTNSYSIIREVLFLPNPNTFLLSPNPAGGTLNLSIKNSGSGALDVRLLDIQGTTLRTWVFLKQDELWTQSIDIGNLPTGSYVIQVIGDAVRVTRSFIKR